jgi:malonate-semialdehyde dehydrogenase (acetylating) / methylmalonate-semialdehyde dehydrogenase
MKDVGHWINGQVRAGTSGQFGNIFNPSVGYQSGRVAFASAA